MKYEFIAPEYLDEEQVKALIKYNFITLKNMFILMTDHLSTLMFWKMIK